MLSIGVILLLDNGNIWQIELETLSLLCPGTIRQLSIQSQSVDAYGGQCLNDDDEFKTTVLQWFYKQVATFFENGIQNLVLLYTPRIKQQ